jgi:hypothetical protein
MPTRTFSTEEIAKLKRLVNEGIQVTSELETLKEGLKETVKAVAEEMDIKPSVLNKAIRIAHKSTLQQDRAAFTEVEEVLEAVGRTL